MILETEIWIEPKECSREEKESGACKDKSYSGVKLSSKNCD